MIPSQSPKLMSVIPTPGQKPKKRKSLKRSRMKPSRPKSSPIRKSAKGEECTIRLPNVCNFDPATTVLCHSNKLADGKGMGLKAPDTHAAYGCSACHDVVDGRAPIPSWLTKELVDALFEEGIAHTQRIVKRKGLA